MSTVDKSILTALKASIKAATSLSELEKFKPLEQAAMAAIKEESVRDSFRRIYQFFQTRARLKELNQEPVPPLTDFAELGKAWFSQSAEFCWQQFPDELSRVPLEALFETMPTPRMLDVAAKKNKQLTQQLIEALSTDHNFVVNGAALDWAVKHSKDKDLLRLAPILLAREASLASPSSIEPVIAASLARDKKGTLFAAYLAEASSAPKKATRLQRAVAANRNVIGTVLATYHISLASEQAQMALDMLKDWLVDYPTFKHAERQKVFLGMSTLISTLLKKNKLADGEKTALELLSSTAATWAKTTDAPPAEGDYWLTTKRSSLVDSTPKDAELSFFGAGLIASAMDKARSGLSAESLLEATAINLGLQPVEKKGERLAFAPDIHEDSVGGILPGDTIVVVQRGWKLADKIVRRAKVVPPPA